MVIYVCTYMHVQDNRQKVETKCKLTGEIIIQQKNIGKDEVVVENEEGNWNQRKKKKNLYFVAASCFRLIFSQFSFIYFPHEKDIDRQHNSKSERAFLNSIPFFISFLGFVCMCV